MRQGKVTATGIVANPDTPEAYLIVEIAFDCPECGQGTLRIPGHHLRTIRDIAIQYCDSHPTLTGSDPTLVESTSFDVNVPRDPRRN